LLIIKNCLKQLSGYLLTTGTYTHNYAIKALMASLVLYYSAAQETDLNLTVCRWWFNICRGRQLFISFSTRWRIAVVVALLACHYSRIARATSEYSWTCVHLTVFSSLSPSRACHESWTALNFLGVHVRLICLSQKRSRCILGSLGGSKYMVTGVKYVKE
jgi:hypothetical protein